MIIIIIITVKLENASINSNQISVTWLTSLSLPLSLSVSFFLLPSLPSQLFILGPSPYLIMVSMKLTVSFSQTISFCRYISVIYYFFKLKVLHSLSVEVTRYTDQESVRLWHPKSNGFGEKLLYSLFFQVMDLLSSSGSWYQLPRKQLSPIVCLIT